MKSLRYLIYTVLIVSFISCKDNPKKKKNQQSIEQSESKLSIDILKSTIAWTGYKTTEKVPVKGVFKEINIINAPNSNTTEGLLEGLAVSIPVSSLFSNLEDRDSKLKRLFFGVMKKTELLSGVFHKDENNKWTFLLTMNGESHPINLNFSENTKVHTVSFTGTLDLEDWSALDALKSINRACLELHKGADGISKTWNLVDIEALVYINNGETKSEVQE